MRKNPRPGGEKIVKDIRNLFEQKKKKMTLQLKT